MSLVFEHKLAVDAAKYSLILNAVLSILMLVFGVSPFETLPQCSDTIKDNCIPTFETQINNTPSSLDFFNQVSIAINMMLNNPISRFVFFAPSTMVILFPTNVAVSLFAGLLTTLILYSYFWLVMLIVRGIQI